MVVPVKGVDFLAAAIEGQQRMERAVFLGSQDRLRRAVRQAARMAWREAFSQLNRRNLVNAPA
jgi:hypothetical protein